MVISLIVAVGAWLAPAQDLAPKDALALVEEYFALDGKHAEDRARQDEILAQLDTLPPLTQKDVQAWRKKLDKLWSKGPSLEKKSGRHYLWEDEERGLYIVGGKTRKPKGLFVGMHGGGAGSGDANTAASSWGAAVSKQGWVGVYPEVLEKVDRGWTESGTEEFVLELVERAMRTWKIPPDKVFFGGHSMGGFGTWHLGAHHADRVAGLTPSAGAPTAVYSGGKVVDIASGVIPNLRNVAMAIYQSDDDPRVPPAPNQKAVELLAKAREDHGGYEAEYWEETGRGHAPPPGGMKALLAKVAGRERVARPDTIVWQPTLPWKRHFYWLWWSEPSLYTKVVARLDREANTVRIEATAVGEGLYVLLDGELLDLEREVVVELNDSEVFRGIPERSLAALVSTARRGDPGLTFDARIEVRP